MLRWSLLPPWAPTERGRTRVDLGKARALVTISVLQQSCVQWLNQEIFGRNERPRASPDSEFARLTVHRDFGKLSVLLSARLFLAAGVPFVGKCNGRGETGGPLLARVNAWLSVHLVSVVA